MLRSRQFIGTWFHKSITRTPSVIIPCRFLALSPPVEEKLLEMAKRHEEIMVDLHSEGKTSAMIGKDLSSLSPAVKLLEERQSLEEERCSISELLEEVGDDAQMKSDCQTELQGISDRIVEIEEKLLEAVVPVAVEDAESDAIIEVRAGTGGDEASLFASELMECYVKTARSLKWTIDMLTETRNDLGGIREASFSVACRGNRYSLSDVQELGPYGTFKFESGVHRVQRIPVNDSSRIHTSACSVAVLPAVQPSGGENDLLPASELRIETMRASGAGGQHVNTTDSAVRITHIPTGITASIQDERSQHKNREKALKLVAARVHEHVRQKEEQARGEARSSLMGGGDRSERIRTYNFPQDRITDHRSKETLHGISGLLQIGTQQGSVTSFLPLLMSLSRDEKLEEIVESSKR